MDRPEMLIALADGSSSVDGEVYMCNLFKQDLSPQLSCQRLLSAFHSCSPRSYARFRIALSSLLAVIGVHLSLSDSVACSP
jgi:hypothetical protein